MQSKKLTTQDFIKKANLKFNNKFDYSLVNYINNRTKVKIICSIHGVFEQIPMSHLVKKGCPKCNIKINAIKRKVSLEEFIRKVNITHKNKYCYSLVKEEENSYDKINIICPIHGIFKQSKSSHCQGAGCRKCAFNRNKKLAKLPLYKFISRAIEIHGDKYDYSLVKYDTCQCKVNIICKNCKVIFKQSVTSHIHQKYGCKRCSYNSNSYKKSDWIKRANGKEGTFYIIRCWNENEEFFKLGITFNSVKYRYANGHKNIMPYNYKIIKEIKSFDLGYIWDLEKRFKRKKLKQHYTPLIKFGGSKYECFK